MNGKQEFLATRPTLSASGSRRMIEAAAVEAQSMSVAVTIVVVDESGVLKEMLRIDGAPLVSVQTAIAGAIGVAGAMTGAEDRSIAEAALKSLEK